MATLRLDRVQLGAGREQVFGELTFALAPGELGAVLGPSRTGKSSVLLLAAGLLPPTKGFVTVDEKKADRKQAGLGPIHDLTPLFETLTVEEHLRFQAHLYGVRDAKGRTEELLQAYDLADVRKSRVKDVGHLEQFHVGLATALVHRPGLVLIDEPERGLSLPEWEVVQRDLRNLTEEGSTVLMTTVLEQVAAAADVVIDVQTGEVGRR